MKTRFERAIQALVTAYFNDLLEKGNPCACAVGNIIIASLGAKTFRFPSGKAGWSVNRNPHWQKVFVTHGNGIQKVNPLCYAVRPAKMQIDATGYTWQELAKIEKAFEGATEIWCDSRHMYTPEAIDADQYKGLMAVVDVLCEIEGIADADEYKALFAGKALVEV